MSTNHTSFDIEEENFPYKRNSFNKNIKDDENIAYNKVKNFKNGPTEIELSNIDTDLKSYSPDRTTSKDNMTSALS